MRIIAIAFLFLTLAAGCGAQDLTDPVAADEQEIGIGPRCGDHFCGAGTYCCNPSCGVCTPKGAFCPQVVCDTANVEAQEQVAEAIAAEEASIESGFICRDHFCPMGTYCCNRSCGMCAPVGAFCPQYVCQDPNLQVETSTAE